MASEARSAPRFFVIKDDMDSGHDMSFERTGGTIGEAPRCPHCGAFIGMRAWLPPLRGKLMLYGEGFGDFVKVPGGGYLVSARFAEAFLAERLTGIPDFQPVTIVRVSSRRRSLKSASPPPYFYMNPVFGGAAVDEARSRIRRASPISCDWCRETNVDTIHGFSLEEGSWRGEDIFDARGLPGSAVVSERFAHFVERHRLTNIGLIPTEEYTWDPLRWGPPAPVH
jgi:hypothetical protein